MERITYTCEIITPMFLAGADGVTPELRAPSIKGALRFWWRALNGHLPIGDIKGQDGTIVSKGLKNQEAQLFGGAGENGGRSPILIQIMTAAPLRYGNAGLVPHKGFMQQAAFETGQTFQIKLTLVKNDHAMDFPKLKALFELSCILGGLGKRSRRGMGSLKITGSTDAGDHFPKKVDLEYIHSLISSISPFYRLEHDTIHFVYPGMSPGFGYVTAVQLGKPDQDPTSTISWATHKVKENNGMSYDPSMGHANRGRYASPLYVSVINDPLRTVITTLNLAPDKNEDKASLKVQQDFKKRLL